MRTIHIKIAIITFLLNSYSNTVFANEEWQSFDDGALIDMNGNDSNDSNVSSQENITKEVTLEEDENTSNNVDIEEVVAEADDENFDYDLRNRKVFDYKKDNYEFFYEKTYKDVNNSHLPKQLNKHDYNEFLIKATLESNVSAVKSLLEKGANIDIQTTDRRLTPLMLAALSDNHQMTKFLIMNNANVNLQSSNGMTALHFAALTDDYKLFRVIFEAGANYKIADNKGNVASNYLKSDNRILFEISSVRNQKELFDLLVKYSKENNSKGIKLLSLNGVDINANDKDGNTPLHYSVRQKSYDSTITLLSEGANPIALNSSNIMPLEEAYLSGDYKLKTLLETAAIKYEIKNNVKRPQFVRHNVIIQQPLSEIEEFTHSLDFKSLSDDECLGANDVYEFTNLPKISEKDSIKVEVMKCDSFGKCSTEMVDVIDSGDHIELKDGDSLSPNDSDNDNYLGADFISRIKNFLT